MLMGIAEILKIVSEGRTFMDRVKLLRKYDCGTLRDVLLLCYDHRIVWGLPKGWVPNYRPCEYPDQHSMLYREMRKIHNFLLPGTHPDMPEEKRKKLFVQLLECLEPEDAEMMIAVKDRRLPFKGIYRKIINEAFGEGFLPPARDKGDNTEGDESETE